MDPCSVCQCDFDVDEETVKLPCDHFFHSDCILPWFKLVSTLYILFSSLALSNNILSHVLFKQSSYILE
jgi:hypothetical protein